MFGKRSTSGPDTPAKAPDASAQRVTASPPLQPGAPAAPPPAGVVERGRAPIPSVGLGAPLVTAPTGRPATASPQPFPPAAAAPPQPIAPAPTDARHTDAYYNTKGQIFGALIEAIDLGQLAKLDAD